MTTAIRINDSIILPTERPCGACGQPDCPDCGTYQLLPPTQPRQPTPPTVSGNSNLVILTKHEDEVAHDRSFSDGYDVGFPDGYRAAVADIRAGRGLKYTPLE